MSIYKNKTNQILPVLAYNTINGARATGIASNISGYISKDGGAATILNDTNPTELDTAKHPGVYIFNLTQSETNCDHILITPLSSVSNIQLDQISIYTDTYSFNLSYDGNATIGSNQYSLTALSTGSNAINSTGVFQILFDLSNVTSSDGFIYKILDKVNITGSQIVLTSGTLNSSNGPAWTSNGYYLAHGWDVTLAKASGTDRNISWSIRKVG